MTGTILHTVGYGLWPTATRAQSLIDALKAHHVQVLVDIRHSPCASDLNPASTGPYRMRSWHLQPGQNGILSLMAKEGIEYVWLVELGNPQKRDPAMAIFREHLQSRAGHWPAERGLNLLRQLVQEGQKVCCLMCACSDVEGCHRKVVAEEFRDRFSSASAPIDIHHL